MEVVYLFPGVHPLYAVSAFVCAIIMLILILRTLYNKKFGTINSHIYLFVWVFFFCIQDGIWGLSAAHIINNPSFLFFTSTIFHLSSAFTAFVWVWFHVSSLKENIKHVVLIRIVAWTLFLLQVVMLATNCFTNFMFFIDEAGEYTSTSYRKILFFIQFAIYISIGLIDMIKLIRKGKAGEAQDLTATFCMNISPIFFGIFQMLYPDAPANSIGFSISCIIFFSFIEAEYERQLTEYRAKALYQEIIEKQNVELIEQKKLLQEALALEAEASQAKTMFLFNMSHDIRTPMNALIGFTTMAKKRIGNIEKTKEYLDKIEITGHQLLSLVNQVLEMSRIESGKMVLNQSKADMYDFAKTIKTVYEDAASFKGIDFKVNTEGIKHNYVITDIDRIKQIITNVIGNAVKYTPEGGFIHFSISEGESVAENDVNYTFTVEDNGIGMSEEFQKHIFDVFAREESTTVNKIQGTGLGMSIVKRLTDFLNGTIDIQSAKGVGTKISITIPMTPDNEPIPVNQNESGDIAINGMKILLVDDNEMNREIATEILEDAGAVIDTAEDGSQAVDKVLKKYEEADVYDCVLMDIQMPKMNGYEATTAIREYEGKDRHIPIIALSANAFEEDRQKSLSMGMDAHISKPINIKELLSTLFLLGKHE